MNPEHILKTIRRAGFNVGETRLVDVRTGKTFSMADATSTTTGERWSVHAATDYGAAVELAEQIGITVPGGFDDINRKLAELAAQGDDDPVVQELLGQLDEIEYRSWIDDARYERERKSVRKQLGAKMEAQRADLRDCKATALEMEKRDGESAAAAWLADQCERIRQTADAA